MNIVVRTYTGHTVTRPDTTYKRGDDASYLPEFVNEVSWAPVVFVRICKAGRSVAAKFADRYYDAVGYGAFLYAENLVDGSPEGFASASCLDHTSFLCYPLYSKETLGNPQNEFLVKKGGRKIFSVSAVEASQIEKEIEEATKSCYIRSGDYLAIELGPRKKLLSAKDGSCRVQATFCENFCLDFEVSLLQ